MKPSLMVFAFALLGVAACSGSTVSATDGGAGEGGSVDGGGGVDGGDSGTAYDASAPLDSGTGSDAAADAPLLCNSLVDVASLIVANQVASDPPMPQGGSVADGTYGLTDATLYTGPGGPTGPAAHARMTVQIMGMAVQVVDDGDPAQTKRSTATLALSGTSLTATNTCPDNKVTQGTYTATATTFAAILPAGSLPDGGGPKTLVLTFTKQ